MPQQVNGPRTGPTIDPAIAPDVGPTDDPSAYPIDDPDLGPIGTSGDPSIGLADDPSVCPVGSSVVVVIGGDRLHPAAVASLPPDAFFIAADSGLDHALAAGIEPDLVVGDFDSISEAGLAWTRSKGVPTQVHPAAKDSTDTELALAAAVAMGATDIVMLSGGGDRLDHSIGAITALGHESLASCRSVSAHWGASLVRVLHGPRELSFSLPIGATFSVLALHGACTGVRESGAQWPLDDALIEPGSSRGISNVCVASSITVSVASGTLTIVVPQHFPPIVKPTATKPTVTKPTVTKPTPAKPVPAKPTPAKPVPAKPAPAITTPAIPTLKGQS